MRARITTSSVHLAWTLSRDHNDINALNSSDSCTHVGPPLDAHAHCTVYITIKTINEKLNGSQSNWVLSGMGKEGEIRGGTCS